MNRDSKIRSIVVMIFISALLALMPLFVSLHPANAGDELSLNGIVISVNYKTGIAIIDVKSRSCQGIRTFNTDMPLYLKGLVGKNISFSIDSSTCDPDKVYKLILPKGAQR